MLSYDGPSDQNRRPVKYVLLSFFRGSDGVLLPVSPVSGRTKRGRREETFREPSGCAIYGASFPIGRSSASRIIFTITTFGPAARPMAKGGCNTFRGMPKT